MRVYTPRLSSLPRNRCIVDRRWRIYPLGLLFMYSMISPLIVSIEFLSEFSSHSLLVSFWSVACWPVRRHTRWADGGAWLELGVAWASYSCIRADHEDGNRLAIQHSASLGRLPWPLAIAAAARSSRSAVSQQLIPVVMVACSHISTSAKSLSII
ncbi:uncharacterized protein PV07_02696 [Cladophialophora immunda]|uniref:Uncharacterized protein n=1 Tax=Cladophialophora immunda TaxID=569365 RepID=A0A0D1ZSL3_9EURO|nr:uncharacterized protein PV07_02696 [Cladophialophora immunda]KIW31011.1 hypothetical protein PV07_02696 [Cladophialophora immunda]